MDTTRRILFLCVANSARSQMAEGLARSLAPDGVEVFSAGSVPTHVHPCAIAAMDRAGIDIRGQHSKSIDDVALDTMDLVITLCAEEYCPALEPGAERVHWPLKDPAGLDGTEAERTAAFVEIADELRQRIGELFAAGKSDSPG